MQKRGHDAIVGRGERPETAAPPAPPPVDLADRLETLRGLMLSFLREVDSIEDGGQVASNPGVDFPEEVRRFEAALICWALRRTGGHRRGAARLLNLKPSTLDAKIRRHRIRADAFETADDTSST